MDILTLPPDWFTSSLCLLPPGPMSNPMKLYPGYFSTGIMSFLEALPPVLARLELMACASASSTEEDAAPPDPKLLS